MAGSVVAVAVIAVAAKAGSGRLLHVAGRLDASGRRLVREAKVAPAVR